jgi:four helix bundle protein
MSRFSDEMAERFLVLVVNILILEKQLCKTYSGRHVYGQLFRAGTSVGANYEESRAGESRADFVHKMQIVLKELREANYWIKLIDATKLCPSDDDVVKFLSRESGELAKIISKSVVTAKSKF